MNINSRLRALLFASLSINAATSACAQALYNYPTRPVTIVVPFPPGGGTDVGARLVAQKLSLKWGQPVIVENRGGAAGRLGADLVAKAKPDGYTLLVGNVGTQSVNPALYKKMPYDSDKAFAPIGMIAELPLVMLVTPTLPWQNVKDVVDAAKKEPGKVTVASSGAGGAPHLAGEIFQQASGTKMLHIAYKGGGPAALDLMAGHVNIYFGTVLESVGHVKSGKLKGLGVTSASRSPALPELPTIAESGYAGFDTGSWIGLLAPAGTPAAIVNKVSVDLREVLALPDTKNTLITQGATPWPMTPEQFAARIDSDRQRYGKIIEENNLSAD
ncbi:MAG: Bug family tripartite tricarboxylate transporter substrate binding protein [Betaproteobacteria bacterium]